MSLQAPNEIARVEVSKFQKAAVAGLTKEPIRLKPEAVTHVNDAILAQVAMQPLEPFQFQGADGAEVEGFVVKPPDFDASKKYPLKFLIHGGPEGGWGDDWSFRWNPELFAANGYVVVMINPHGSTGYGQKFTEGVIGQWGGTPFVDLMKGLDYAEENVPVYRQESRGGARRELWRVYDQLIGYLATPTASNASSRMTASLTPSRLTGRRRSSGFRSGSSRVPRGNNASSTVTGHRPLRPRSSKRRRWWCTGSSIIGSMFRRGSIFSPLCSGSACLRRCSMSPMKDTGYSSRKTAGSGIRP